MWPQCQRHLASKILRIRPSGQAALAGKVASQEKEREREMKKENGRRMETLQHMCRGAACIREYRVRHKKQACASACGPTAKTRQHLIITRAFSCSHKKMQLGASTESVCSASPPGWRGDSHRKHVLASVLTTGEPRKKTCLSILMKFSIQGEGGVLLNLLLLLK